MRKFYFVICILFFVIGVQSQNWKQVNVQGMGFITGVIANKAAQNEVYVRTDVGGMFSWNNASGAWVGLLDSTSSTWNHMDVESFAVDQTTSGTSTVIYAAADGILKSTNKGQSWVKSGFPDSVYMNGNAFWRHCGERLMIDPQNKNILFFGSRKQGLYKSIDGAGSWTKPTSIWTNGGKGGSSQAGGIAFVAFDPRSSEQLTSPIRSKNIYIGVIGNIAHAYSIYKSTDGGVTWAVMNGAGAPPNTQHPVRGVVASDGTLYVTTTTDAASTWQGFSSPSGGIFKYNPTISAWTNITPSGCNSGPLTFGCVSWAALAVDPNNPLRIFATSFNEGIRDILYSVDGGINWKIVTDDAVGSYPPASYQHAIYNIPAWGYAGTGYKFSWSGAIAVDPFNAKKIYVTTGYAVHVTEDISLPTVTWNTPMKGLEELVVNVVKVPAKLNGAELLSGVADMAGFRHADKNTPPTSKFVPNAHGITTSIDWMQTNPDVIVKVGGDQGTNGLNSNSCSECGYSTDNGQSWTQFSLPTANGWGEYTDGNIAIGRSAQNNASLNLVWFPSPKRSTASNLPVYSFNSGTTWAECSFDFGNVWQNSCADQYWFNAEMIAADRVKDSTFYAFIPNWYSSNSTYCQLFKSTNGGKNFSKIFSYQKQWDINGKSIGWYETHKVTIKPNPKVAGEVWIKIGSNLFKCPDALVPVTSTQPNFQPVNATVLTSVKNFGWGAPYPSSVNPTLFVAGTVNGVESVFSSTDLGATWKDILGKESISLANVMSIDGDMNRPGKVFVGTSNRGVFYYEDPSLVTQIANTEMVSLKGEMSIFPNPTTDNFSLNFTSDYNGLLTIRLVDMYGKLILENRGFKLDNQFKTNYKLPNLKNGNYIVNVKTTKGESYSKVLVVKE